MRRAAFLLLTLSAACSGAAPEPEGAPPPAVPSPAVTPAPAQPPAAQPTPHASPTPAAPAATAPEGTRAADPLEVPLLTPVWGKSLPPPPTAYEPEVEARAAPYQACTRDRDCAVAVEGCCDERGYARGIGVARKQLEAYRSLFSCPTAKCATRAGDMLCGDGPTPRCETVRAPKARCVEGRCTFHGHY
jgi:hypothetical protein